MSRIFFLIIAKHENLLIWKKPSVFSKTNKKDNKKMYDFGALFILPAIELFIETA